MAGVCITRAEAANELIQRRKARGKLLSFMQYVWWWPHPFIKAAHTIRICRAIDQAVTRLFQGQSTYLDLEVPYRHGKTDIVSRALPSYFLGRAGELEPDIMLTGYGAELIESFSKDVKRIVSSEKYLKLYPSVRVAKGNDTVSDWAIENSAGRVTAAGLGGALVGKGAMLLVIDDWCKNRAEARSDTYRNRMWDAFTNDIMTRLGPAHIVVLCGTSWHVDDIRGRIRKKEASDSNFPKFEHLTFPARIGDDEFLFEQRYTKEWYRRQYALLGKWASGLLDCAPTVEGGNRFKVDGVKIHDDIKDFPDARYHRCWDLAHSEKQRSKDDPDYTVGLLGTVVRKGDVDHIWIKDVIHCKEEAPARDAMIRATTERDGAGVSNYVEAFTDAKDAFTTLKHLLKGKRIVVPSRLPRDKSAKMASLEPIFEAGNVHLLRANWNQLFISQFRDFPDGIHDDFCDPVAILYHETSVKEKTLFVPIA